MQQIKTQLKTWLFTKPIIFASLCIGFGLAFGLCYALIQTFLNFESMVPIYILFGLSILLPACYIIKKLPHTDMNQNDFVAITNGAGIISIAASFLAIILAMVYSNVSQHGILTLYMFHPLKFYTLVLLTLFSSLYLIGVAISNIYAKYKRAVTLGISPWKVILSMPFAFLLMWTPGYLVKGKDGKSGLKIKSSWYNKLNKWVLSNFNNTLFAFVFLLFFKSVIAGTMTLVLATISLIIYTLWYVKHKSDFVANINNGYASTAVCINLAILIAVLTQLL